MIGIVDVEVQAANPQMPLCPFVAFVGSPSSVRVRNVPGNVGSWNITKVYVSANYPDNSIQSRECTRVGEIYVGTLPACNAVGKGANGFVVSADGVDESGNAVTGYVLGKGDLEILDADGAITPGVTTHYVHGLDEQPSDPHEYDIYKDGDTWKIYFDGAWGSLAPALTLDDAVTRTSANGVKSSGIWSAIWGALSALPTGFTSLYDWCVVQLAGKLSTSGGTVTGDISMPNGLLEAGDVVTRSYFDFNKPNESSKYLDSPENSGKALTDADIQDSSSALGAALYGKANRAANPTDGNLAALDAQGNPTDSEIPAANVALKGEIPYSLGTPTVIDEASTEVVEGETVYYGAATLADRTANIVGVAVALDELRVTIPPAVSGKVRDFGLYVAVGLGEGTALAAPALVPVAPTGETITIMNAEGEMPTLADGTTTASGTTVLYFSEVVNGVFLVKGEQIQEVA